MCSLSPPCPPPPQAINLLIRRAQPSDLLTQQSGADGSRGSKFQARNNLMTCLGKDCSKKIPLRSWSSPCPCLRQSPDELCDCPTSGSGASLGSCWKFLAWKRERFAWKKERLETARPWSQCLFPRAWGCGATCQGREPRAWLCVASWVIHPFFFPHFPGFLKPFFCLQAIWNLLSVFAGCRHQLYLQMAPWMTYLFMLFGLLFLFSILCASLTRPFPH